LIIRFLGPAPGEVDPAAMVEAYKLQNTALQRHLGKLFSISKYWYNLFPSSLPNSYREDN